MLLDIAERTHSKAPPTSLAPQTGVCQPLGVKGQPSTKSCAKGGGFQGLEKKTKTREGCTSTFSKFTFLYVTVDHTCGGLSNIKTTRVAWQPKDLKSCTFCAAFSQGFLKSTQRQFHTTSVHLSHHEYMNLHKRSAINVFSGSKNEEPVGHAFRMKSFGRHDYQKNCQTLRIKKWEKKIHRINLWYQNNLGMGKSPQFVAQSLAPENLPVGHKPSPPENRQPRKNETQPILFWLKVDRSIWKQRAGLYNS